MDAIVEILLLFLPAFAQALLPAETFHAQAVFDLVHQGFPVERFGQVTARTALHGVDRLSDGTVGGENDDRQMVSRKR